MAQQLLHIFRNNPLGRETLLQSIYFCKMVNAAPVIYVPRHPKFLMYFENDVVQIDLDSSYLTNPETAHKHAAELVEQAGIEPRFLEPKHFTASTLPDIQTNYDYMCCPRSVSDLSSKIGLGYIGPRVRRIVHAARFPVLITSPVYKEWKSIAVFFGGSANAFKALKLGLRISRMSGLQLDIFTQLENDSKETYQEMIEKENLTEEVDQYRNQWHVFENGVFEENLYAVPHDALIIIGAYLHNIIRDIVFKSKMEKIQSNVTNNLLIAGPNYTAAR